MLQIDRDGSEPRSQAVGGEHITWEAATESLRAFAMRRGLPPQDAEDFTQEVAVRIAAILVREAAVGVVGLPTARQVWAVGQRVLREIRRRSLARSRRERAFFDDEETPDRDLSHSSEASDDLVGQLRDRWPGLRFHPKEVLYLQHFSAGYGTCEIAKLLGWTEAATWSTRQRIFGKVKKMVPARS